MFPRTERVATEKRPPSFKDNNINQTPAFGSPRENSSSYKKVRTTITTINDEPSIEDYDDDDEKNEKLIPSFLVAGAIKQFNASSTIF